MRTAGQYTATMSMAARSIAAVCAIRDEVEGLVLGERQQQAEALLREVQLNVKDAEVALVLRVVEAHRPPIEGTTC